MSIDSRVDDRRDGVEEGELRLAGERLDGFASAARSAARWR